MSDFYEATFRWPRSDASNVIITGSFDGWSCSQRLAKSSSGYFQGTVQVPWGEKVAYKYIVDGKWATTDDRPTEMDPLGNLNNVFRAPARPVPEPTSEPVPEPETESERTESEATTETEASTVGTVSGIFETAKQAMVSMVEALAPGTAETPAVETPPAHSEPEPTTTNEVANNAIVLSEPTIAPIVPIGILPLGAEPTTDAVSAPVADVSETKPLDTTVVEGTTTTSPSIEPEDRPSTHSPAPAPKSTSDVVNGTTSESEKPVTNGVTPTEDESTANGVTSTTGKTATNGTPAPPVTDGTTESPKPPVSPSPTSAAPAVNGTADKYATVNGSSTPSKKMRFPSLSSRHSRARSSVESGPSVNEHGEKSGANGIAKDTASSRLTGSERQKRRTSLFGKLKEAFSHSHHKHGTEA